MKPSTDPEEIEFIAKYSRDVQTGKFPVQCITVDPVVFYKGKLLLVKRKNHPGKGRFSLPGGFVNQSETLLQAVVRECKEETGVDLNINWLFQKEVFDNPKRAPGVRIVTHAHGFIIPSNEAVSVQWGDDAAFAFWVDRDDFLINYVDKCHEDHYEVVCRFGYGFLKSTI